MALFSKFSHSRNDHSTSSRTLFLAIKLSCITISQVQEMFILKEISLNLNLSRNTETVRTHCNFTFRGIEPKLKTYKTSWQAGNPNYQCSGSMTFWCGSGSGTADPCLWLMDPDPAIFVIDLQDANIKQIYKKIAAYYFWRYIYIIFQRKKSKRSHNTVP